MRISADFGCRLPRKSHCVVVKDDISAPMVLPLVGMVPKLPMLLLDEKECGKKELRRSGSVFSRLL